MNKIKYEEPRLEDFSISASFGALCNSGSSATDYCTNTGTSATGTLGGSTCVTGTGPLAPTCSAGGGA